MGICASRVFAEYCIVFYFSSLCASRCFAEYCAFFDILRIYVVSVATQASGTYESTPPCLRASFLVSASNYRKKRSTQRKRKTHKTREAQRKKKNWRKRRRKCTRKHKTREAQENARSAKKPSRKKQRKKRSKTQAIKPRSGAYQYAHRSID